MKKLIIDAKEYDSRLILGTGKYKDFNETKAAIESSSCEMVTVAIRRINIGQDKEAHNLLDYISPKKIHNSSKYCRLLYSKRCCAHM
jgi:thiazole synthase